MRTPLSLSHRLVRWIGPAASVALTSLLQAGLPQPMIIYYGQALDEFGWPFRDNADVILRVGEQEYARHAIHGSLAPGVNFALYVHLDDGRDAVAYSPEAIRLNQRVTISVRDRGGERPILENATLPRPTAPGDILYVKITAGEDTDGDGLPDRWEQEVISSQLHPEIDTPERLSPSDDYDQDGMSNADEYLAGTFAFLGDDYTAIERITVLPSGRLRCDFFSVVGKVYSLASTADLSAPDWRSCPVSFTESGPLHPGPIEASQGLTSVFFEVSAPAQYYRLDVR
jgi:hypothetical protein